jgi:hypothetical protein
MRGGSSSTPARRRDIAGRPLFKYVNGNNRSMFAATGLQFTTYAYGIRSEHSDYRHSAEIVTDTGDFIGVDFVASAVSSLRKPAATGRSFSSPRLAARSCAASTARTRR